MSPRGELRTRIRAARNALPAPTRSRNARHLAHRLSRTRAFRAARRIAGYLPADGEIDPAPLLALALQLRKRVYLPVLAPCAENRLWFCVWRSGEALTPNRYGILEPVHRELVPACALDLVLAPLVAFDPQGNRLGMGGGYYDRSFAFLLHRRHWHKPRLIGIAHELQKVPVLPSEPWDVPLHAIATEDALYLPRRTVTHELLADEVRTRSVRNR